MSAIHEFKCNQCGKREPATYNGEHWLMPHGWGQLYDDAMAQTIDEHLCRFCRPRPKKSKASKGLAKNEE